MSVNVNVGPLDEIAPGSARRVDAAGRAICLVRCGDHLYALDDVCSHEDYSLSEGEVDVEECAIECWKHGSFFSLETGDPLSLPATRPVAVYGVAVEDGQIVVTVPDGPGEEGIGQR